MQASRQPLESRLPDPPNNPHTGSYTLWPWGPESCDSRQQCSAQVPTQSSSGCPPALQAGAVAGAPPAAQPRVLLQPQPLRRPHSARSAPSRLNTPRPCTSSLGASPSSEGCRKICTCTCGWAGRTKSCTHAPWQPCAPPYHAHFCVRHAPCHPAARPAHGATHLLADGRPLPKALTTACAHLCPDSS